MTPQEIFEYKQRWYPGQSVTVHSDLRSKCKQWCKNNVQSHKWKMAKDTNVYEDTFFFEDAQTKDLFMGQFREWCDR
jgi:hypothetical protein